MWEVAEECFFFLVHLNGEQKDFGIELIFFIAFVAKSKRWLGGSCRETEQKDLFEIYKLYKC